MIVTYDSLVEASDVVTELQDKVSEKKYQLSNEKSFSDVLNRIVSETLKRFEYPYDKIVDSQKLRDIILNGRFIPAGSILYGLGNKEVKCSLSNCYVAPIENDSIEGIFDTLKKTARTFSYRGGTGIDITVLRPMNANVRNAAKKSSGAVSFLPLISEVTNTIGQCISKDEKVLTPYGFKRIGDVQVNDEVWTHEGFVRVINTVDSGVKETFVLKSKKGFSVQLTGDHTIANYQDGQFIEKKVSDCVPGDQILLSVGDGSVTHLVEYVPLSINEYQKSEYNNSNRLDEDVAFPVVINEDFGWLIGYIYGNGCFSGKHDYLSIAIPHNHPEIMDRVVRIFKEQFNVDVSVTNGDGAVYDIDVRRKLVSQFFTHNGLRKDKAQCIDIPEKIATGPKSVLAAFIAGFFDADGNNGGRKSGYRFDTTSCEFAEAIRLTLLTWGICSVTHITPLDQKRNTVVYRLSVVDCRSKSLLYSIMKDYSLKITPFNEELGRDHTITPFTARDLGISYSKFPYVPYDSNLSYNAYHKIKTEAYPQLPHPVLVDTVEQVVPAGETEVCDITLEKVNYFWCNGIYVHNCGRRGALLVSIDIRHPDAMRFIWCKSKPEEIFGKDFLTGKVPDVYGANISVKLTDKFMQAVIDNKDWTFIYPDIEYDIDFYNEHWKGDYDAWIALGGKIKEYTTLPARDIMQQIAEAAHLSGDPGVLFIDTVIEYTPGAHIDTSLKPMCTNPCFAGYTLIETLEGPKEIKDLVGKKVTIFDGENWVECDNFRITGIDQKLIRISLSNGAYLDVTPYHTMYVVNDSETLNTTIIKTTADKLKIGDKLESITNDIVVTEIRELPGSHVVYCCTINTTHKLLTSTGVFTGNCGEQPLGPYNNCLLGALVLSQYVENPWSENAQFNTTEFLEDVKTSVVFMNIMSDINVDLHPLQEQRDTDRYGKRIGIEFTALGDTLAMLNMEYGSEKSIAFVEEILRAKAITEIETSAILASYGKCCPALQDTKNREKFINSTYIKNLQISNELEQLILNHGLANVAFNTVGPTGSISIMSNNCTSGIEPLFMFSYSRQTRLDPGKYFTMIHKPAIDYLLQNRDKFELEHGVSVDVIKKHLNYVEAWEIDVHKRIAMQAAVQKYIDASISSTINLPENTTVDQIVEIYIEAWRNKLKGITVFRDGCKKGVLSSTSKTSQSETNSENAYPTTSAPVYIRTPGDEERCIRYRVSWKGSKMYIIVTLDENDRPLEVFAKLPREAGINGNGVYSEEHFQEKYSLWESITRLVSLALRANIDLDRIISQLEKSVYSVVDATAILCRILRKFQTNNTISNISTQDIIKNKLGKKCQECGEYAYVYENGCGSCRNCGYTSCG